MVPEHENPRGFFFKNPDLVLRTPEKAAFTGIPETYDERLNAIRARDEEIAKACEEKIKRLHYHWTGAEQAHRARVLKELIQALRGMNEDPNA